jgi:uncharacterized protein (DUF427 family)
MAEKPHRVPGPDHPITIERSSGRVLITAAGRIIADTREALILREASYPIVEYVPRKDTDMSQLERSSHTTYCPYKGDCSYYSIPAAGDRSINAVWTYETPYPAVAEIAGYLAFYPGRVDKIEHLP